MFLIMHRRDPKVSPKVEAMMMESPGVRQLVELSRAIDSALSRSRQVPVTSTM